MIWATHSTASQGDDALPNGGSDCCGTCWFNRANGGEKGSDHHDHSIPSYCEIRDLPIKDPFYTYCANHPYRMQRRVPVPLGPVDVHVAESFERDGKAYYASGREVWVHARDTDDVRAQLLEFLKDPGSTSDHYPFYGDGVLGVVVDELERLRETRAIPILERIAQELRGQGEAWDNVQDAMARIRKAVGEATEE